MALRIETLHGLEVLDSRGRPTVEATVRLSDGTEASAQVPSGASTGRHEALELRDGEAERYGGLGVRRAVRHVDGEIAEALREADAEDLQGIDRTLRELDGTPDKSRLGANATLAVSCAAARALSVSRREPLWRVLASVFRPAWSPSLPRPMVNIFSGGHHAAHNIEIQDFLAVPLRSSSYSEALEAIVAVHGAARAELASRGLPVTGVADEGGWGPMFPSNEAALEALTASIERAGYRPGEDCAIAVDVAASHFGENGNYRLKSEDRSLSTAEFLDLLERWRRRYPVVSLEDALEQDDWEGWRQLQTRMGDDTQLIGDDFFTTNPQRVRRGIDSRAANAVLVKMNQIGTLSETFEVVNLAAGAGWRAVISARSGETEDSFLADLATATGAGQIKVGSITRSERLAKYNRLLAIERTGELPWAGSAPL